MKFIQRKYLFFIFVIGSLFSSRSQIINPIAFSFSVSFPSYGQIINVAEDTITNFLHFQNSCNCGIGPSNKWTALSYVNLGTNIIKTPYFYYGPYGVQLFSEKIYANNSKIIVNDKDFITEFTSPTYSPQVWAYTATVPEKIVGSARRNDSLFEIVDDGATCQSLQLLNATTGATMAMNSVNCTTMINGTIVGTVLSSEIQGGMLFLAGSFLYYDQFSNPIDTNAVAISITSGSVIPLNYGTNDTIKDLKIYNGKIHIAGNFTTAKGQVRNRYASFDLSGNLQAATPGFSGNIEQLEVYDKYLFALGKYTAVNGNVINPSGNFVLKAVNLNSNSLMNWSLPVSSSIPNDEFVLENFRNRLYYFSNKIASTFIDAVCLPPVMSVSAINSASTTVCEQTSNVGFNVPPFLYASNYNWFYTGTGATLSQNNNSVTINFGAGATSGKLKMVASSACGGRSDTLSLNITVVPRPGATATLVDDTINCFKPKVPILGNSLTSGVGYTWSGPAGYSSNQKYDSTAKYVAGTYVLTVTILSTGCTSTASVVFKLDTLKPNVTLPLPPYIIPCNPNSLLLSGSSTTSPALLQWKNSFGTVLHANPYSATGPGTYLLIVQDLYNGCNDSKTITVTTSTAVPIVAISSHTNYVNFSIAADSISCYTPSVQINASATPSNCSIQWKDKATNLFYPNPITVTTQGNYMPIVTRLDNSCADSSKIVYIKQNMSPPIVTVLTPSPNINCSFSTATLNAVSSPSATLQQWINPTSFTLTNPAVVSYQGKYYFTATDLVNGCKKTDSVIVGYANVLVVNAGNDTVVCKNSIVPLNAVVAGSVSPIVYSWSNSAITQSTSVSNATTTDYIVSVSGSGCNGADTVRVIIPDNIQDSIVTFKGCTGNSGNMVIYAKGGVPPYKYSLNGSTFASVNTFSNLAFATYTISIKDSIGCIVSTTASINQTSNSTVPEFIASTQNFKGDTVVLVDLTIPKADSINWILPSIATKIGGDMYSPVIVFADTGSFAITMEAYYGNCMISATKTIRILPYDSAYATLTNYNGIKLLNVFPNPNTGVFTVNVDFYKKQNVSIQIWDTGSQKHYQNNFIETDTINLPVSLPQLQNGTYILRVISEFSSKHFNFVISK